MSYDGDLIRALIPQLPGYDFADVAGWLTARAHAADQGPCVVDKLLVEVTRSRGTVGPDGWSTDAARVEFGLPLEHTALTGPVPPQAAIRPRAVPSAHRGLVRPAQADPDGEVA